MRDLGLRSSEAARPWDSPHPTCISVGVKRPLAPTLDNLEGQTRTHLSLGFTEDIADSIPTRLPLLQFCFVPTQVWLSRICPRGWGLAQW